MGRTVVLSCGISDVNQMKNDFRKIKIKFDKVKSYFTHKLNLAKHFGNQSCYKKYYSLFDTIYARCMNNNGRICQMVVSTLVICFRDYPCVFSIHRS